MSDKNIFRVAVGEPDAMNSSIWRFWTYNNEIYVAAREAARILKLSLHSSGFLDGESATWRLAYVPVSEINDPLINDDDRVIARWKKPKEFKQGWTQCLDIIVPEAQIKRHFSMDKKDKPKGSLFWLRELPRGHKWQITLLSADSSSRNVNEVIQDGDQKLGQFALEDGRVAWILSRLTEMSKVEREHVEALASDMKINYESDPGHGVFAAMMIIDKDRNYPIITNFSLGWENVYIDHLQSKVGL